jgi:predicted MPP superfamily phosphohydrolase
MSANRDREGVTAVKFLTADEIERRLASRLGGIHAKQRLGIEADHEAQAFGQGLNFLHLENMPASQAIIEGVLRVSGMYWRGRANAQQIQVRKNDVAAGLLPAAFEQFTILQLSDLHADMNLRAMDVVIRLVRELRYDLCVLTGDYRGKTFGAFESCLATLRELREVIKGDIYGVLGNHDSIRMVPDVEDMGMSMLLNEHVAIQRGDAKIYLAGIDDAHFYRVDNIEKAALGIPEEAFSILLSHTPEIYRQAAHAGFDLLLSGHTHGGQICLPGGVPIILEAELPRSMGKGAWRYAKMAGYTSAGAGSSVVPVRFNCAPEITLHRLVIGI